MVRRKCNGSAKRVAMQTSCSSSCSVLTLPSCSDRRHSGTCKRLAAAERWRCRATKSWTLPVRAAGRQLLLAMAEIAPDAPRALCTLNRGRWEQAVHSGALLPIKLCASDVQRQYVHPGAPRGPSRLVAAAAAAWPPPTIRRCLPLPLGRRRPRGRGAAAAGDAGGRGCGGSTQPAAVQHRQRH